jgi:hypothetical protein
MDDGIKTVYNTSYDGHAPNVARRIANPIDRHLPAVVADLSDWGQAP